MPSPLLRYLLFPLLFRDSELICLLSTCTTSLICMCFLSQLCQRLFNPLLLVIFSTGVVLFLFSLYFFIKALTPSHIDGVAFVKEMRTGKSSAELSKYYSFTTPPPPALPTFLYKSGSPFDKDFAIESELSGGSFGKVYKCKRVSDNLHITVKEVDLQSSAVTKFAFIQELLLNEAALLVKLHDLDSEHFVQLIDAYKQEEKVFLVMEYFDGFNLLKFVPRDSHPEATLLTDKAVILVIMREILKAVKVMHDHGWRHRDIKAENVFITTDGRVKLIDLGSAGPVGDMNGIGTPYYMPVESFDNDPSKGDLFGPYGRHLLTIVKRKVLSFLRGYEPVDIYSVGQTMEAITDPSVEDVFEFSRACFTLFNPCYRWTAASLLDHPMIAEYNGRRLVVGNDFTLTVQ